MTFTAQQLAAYYWGEMRGQMDHAEADATARVVVPELLARVEVLEKAARAVIFEPLAYGPTTTVRVDLLRALENLLPDQSGEGGS